MIPDSAITLGSHTSGAITTISVENGYTVIYINDNPRFTEIIFRNVSKKDHTIQFRVEERKIGGNKKIIYFNIPKSLVDLFIERLKTIV